MSRGPQTFKQCDLDRAIRAAKKGGLTDYEIIVDGSRVTVRVGGPARVQRELIFDEQAREATA